MGELKDCEYNTSSDQSSDNIEHPGFYEFLKREAPFVEGHAGGLINLSDIPWANKDLIEKGAEFHQRYYGIIYIHFAFTVLLSTAHKPGATVMYRMGNRFKSKEMIVRKLFTDLTGIRNLYGLTTRTEKDSNEDFERVVRLHIFGAKTTARGAPLPELLPPPSEDEELLAHSIRKDLKHMKCAKGEEALHENRTWSPQVPISQFDMGVGMLVPFYSLWRRTERLGEKFREGMEAHIHCTAIIGRLLGVKDEFNVCLHKDGRVFQQMFEEVVLGSYRRIDSYTVHLQTLTIEGMKKLVPIVTYKGFVYASLKYVLEVEGYTGDNIWRLMGWKDKLFAGAIRVGIWLLHAPGFDRLANVCYSGFLLVLKWTYGPKSHSHS